MVRKKRTKDGDRRPQTAHSCLHTTELNKYRIQLNESQLNPLEMRWYTEFGVLEKPLAYPKAALQPTREVWYSTIKVTRKNEKTQKPSHPLLPRNRRRVSNPHTSLA